MPDPLFDYSAATNPSPLEAGSDPEKGTKASINISVLHGEKTLYANKIAVSVPINPQSGTAYFTENPQIAVNNDTWQPVSLAEDDDLIQPDANHYVVTFHNANPKTAVTYPLVFSISGLIAAAPGDPLLVQVVESSSTKPQGFTRKDARTLSMPVIQPVFYLRNFLARSASSPTVPRTRINAGDSIQLSWESNGSYFWLYDGENDTPRYEGTGTSWTVPSGTIHNDTTFVLKASAADGTQQAVPDGFETVEQYASLTITVKNPTLTGLTVTGSITAESTLDLYGSLTARDNVSVGEALTVSQGLGVSGNITAWSELEVHGSLDARGNVTVGSQVTADDIEVRDKMSTSGHHGLRVLLDLSVDGSIAGFGGAEFVEDNGTYVRIRELRGPLSEALRINSTVKVLDDCGFSVAGKDVIRHGDYIGLWNYQKEAWLYASDYKEDSDRNHVFVWMPGNRVGGGSWWVSRD